eukprot:2533519-Lingulodinium_polyedra.AAC.1
MQTLRKRNAMSYRQCTLRMPSAQLCEYTALRTRANCTIHCPIAIHTLRTNPRDAPPPNASYAYQPLHTR